MERFPIRDTLSKRALTGDFDGLFLAELLLYGLATVLFLFYFNRIFGLVIGLLINTYTWTFYSATVRIQAIQVSPLGGRIFLKGVRYQGQNETILAHDGYITWRYWFRRVRRPEAIDKRGNKVTKEGINNLEPVQSRTSAQQDHKKATNSPPCRLRVKVRGLEWFVYNRSPAYDTLLSTLIDPVPHDDETESTPTSPRRDPKPSKSPLNEKEKSSPVSDEVDTSDTVSPSSSNQPPTTRSSEGVDLPLFLQSLPIRITGSRAAMVMGNRHTKSILVAKIRDFDGLIDARAAGPEDQYRQCFDFHLSQGTIAFKPNRDYTGTNVEEGAKFWQGEQPTEPPRRSVTGVKALFSKFRRALSSLQKLNPFAHSSRTSLAPNDRNSSEEHDTSQHPTDNNQTRWLGLSRYLVEDTAGEIAFERWRAIEYAKVETVADIQSMSLNFFWDVAGPVKYAGDRNLRSSDQDHVNGTNAPGYGLDVHIGGGRLNYGPWADRQRASLQSVFFPATYARAKLATRLGAGAWRVSTVFEIRIALDEEVVLRVDTREESKDWRWKDQLVKTEKAAKTQSKKQQANNRDPEKGVPDPEIRPSGWVEVTVAKDSTVVYKMDMFSHADGYHNFLDLDVKSPQVSTSVNHDLLCRASSLCMKCDLSNPRLWKALHEWVFGISTENFELFLLRDHAFLIQDLVNDWTSGPSADFFEYVPFVYRITLQMPGTKVYMNVNDSNIINNPSSLEDNAFIVLGAQHLDAALAIPLTDFQALQSRVSFEADAYQMTLDLSTPPWTTQKTFFENKQVAELDQLRFSGSYNYYTSTSAALTDTVLLNLDGSGLQLKLFGFLVRYFMNFKENYFGEDLHFQTQEEFQEKVEIADNIRLPTKETQRNPRQSNDLDVILTVIARDLAVEMPSLLYSAEEHLKITTPLTSLDLRFTNYYMDMQADFSPLSISNGTVSGNGAIPTKEESGTQLFIDGAAVIGHRLFGLPPTEPPYVCNWDFDVGQISGETSLEMISNAIGAAQSFAYGFPDAENAIKRLNALIIRDALFLRANVQPIKLWIHVEDSAFLLSTDDLSVHFNDWAGERSSERLSVDMPSIIFACVNAKSAARSRAKIEQNIETYAFLQTSLNLRLIETKPEFVKERQLQQEHLIVSDIRTHRIPWMIRDDANRSAAAALEPHKTRPPAMPFPSMPEPLRSSDSDSSRKDISSGFFLEPSTGHKNRVNGTGSSRGTEAGRRASPSLWTRTDRDDGTSSRNGRLSVTDVLDLKPGNSPPSMRHFSPYARPYFPLLGVNPSPAGLPEMPSSSHKDAEYASGFEEQQMPTPDGHKKSLVLMVNLEKGIRGLFTPEAVLRVTSLAYGLQATRPDGILDDIQTGTMSSVLSRGRPKPSSITEVRCELPGAAIRLQNRGNSTTNGDSKLSWYDLFMQRLALNLRHTSADPGLDSLQLAVHASLRKLDFNILSLDDGGLEQNVFKFELDSTTAWASMGRGISANMHLDNIAIASLNRDTKLLANVINQAIRFAQSASKMNEEKQTMALHRRVALVHFLATLPKNLAEAPFMTTTSFTLRTVKFNPRNSDSWKLASRLRWVLHTLHPEERSSLMSKLQSSEAPTLAEVKETTLSAFHQWRGWDLTGPETSVFVNNVFGAPLSTVAVANETMSKPIHISGSIAQFFVAVDPGPKQDSFTFQLMSCVASNLAEPSKDLEDPVIEDTLSVGLFCKHSDLNVKWEMVELIAGLSKQVEAPDAEERDEPASPEKEKSAPQFQRNVHIIVALEQLSTRIETINLDLATRCFGVTGSMLLSLDPETPLNESLALYSTHVISELSTQQTSIMAYKLQQPSIHLSRAEAKSTPERTVISAGGFCENLELHITQDLLSILGVVDRVLTDEVHFFQKVARNTKRQTPTTPSAKPSGKAIELHAALLLDSYSLSTKVLSTLQYAIRGTSARSSCRSSPGDTQTTVLDFDVGAFTHTFTNYDDDKAYQIASFSLPPVNGQVSVEQGDAHTTVALAVALEEIVLDASALHAIFTTYSRSELTAFRENIARDIKFLKANYENVMSEEMPQDHASQVSLPLKPLLYRAHISAEGLKIRARTSRTSSYSARLTFQLSHLNFSIHNVENAKKQLTRPEMSAELRTISIRLKRSTGARESRCGDFSIAGSFTGTSRMNEDKSLTRSWEIVTTELDINMYPETASTVVDIIGYLQQRFKSFNFSEEINTLTLRARRLRTKSRTFPALMLEPPEGEGLQDTPTSLFSSMYSLEMNLIHIVWHVGDEVVLAFPSQEIEDLRFSISRVHLSTSKGNAGRLTIQNLQLQMAPRTLLRAARSQTSALMPEVAFNVAYFSTSQDRRLAFQAVGKVIDIRLTAQSVIAGANLQKSIAVATHDLRKVVAGWNAAFVKEEQTKKNILGNKTLSSVLVAADFAGAVVHLSGKVGQNTSQATSPKTLRSPQSKSSPDVSVKGMELQAPGITLKLEYRHPTSRDPSLNSEIQIEPSSNTLHPAVVPLLYEMSDSIKAVMGERGKQNESAPQSPTKPSENDPFKAADPTTILGRTRLNLGLRVCKQQFGLTCQPIARVAATAQFDDIYFTVSTVQSQEQGRFFALSASILSLQSTLQHVYSREPTGSFLIERVTLSLMNSRHVSDVIGVSAILKVSPMVLNVNAKQMHDFFLFKEIWLPADVNPATRPATPGAPKRATFGVKRYQEVAATGAFPWNALVNIDKMEVQLDLGQSLGKSAFSITGLWLASTKSSDWEQNLCVGFEKIGINSTGRLSGFVELQNFRIQSSIQWPEAMRDTDRTPLVEASTTIGQLQAKLAFEYQAFLVADISTLQFLMYNVRDPTHASGDRLVCLVEGDMIQAFCTTQTSAQFVSLYQAIQRLIQEKKAAYETSLKEVENFLQRKSNTTLETPSGLLGPKELDQPKDENLIPLQLQTNVVVGLKAVKVGAYPRSFFDNQIFKIEALDASMRFSVAVEDGQVQSGLGLTLGQVRIALSNLTERVERKTFEDMQVAEVVKYSTGSRGGTILKVPELIADMQTWQEMASFHIDYLFKSSFEGRVEVGWNYARISYIRGMWASHSRTLAQRLGKPLPQSAVQITSGLEPAPAADGSPGAKEQETITAVVNVPLSKYEYTALEPPLIVTPQLRDMGDATPPLEWIGLHRDRLPNLTHQIVIVPLLEVAKEVEDAYSRILGNS